jgi:cytidine deaminase
MTDNSELHTAACEARARAHAPYSRFRVGAAIRGASGQIYVGANVENASYPEGWCAETSAISALIMAGETEITGVCVVGTGEQLVVPCGGCRQRLSEFSGLDTPVLIGNESEIRRTFTLGHLLPEAFQLVTDNA